MIPRFSAWTPVSTVVQFATREMAMGKEVVGRGRPSIKVWTC